jgi:transposase-like protein
MNKTNQRYYGYRFPPEIISHAVWLYHRYCLSFGDIEDLLAERGITVSYETIRNWCIKFGPEYARKTGNAEASLVILDTWMKSTLWQSEVRDCNCGGP